MRPPLVQHLPDETQLSRRIDDRFESDGVDVCLAAGPRIQQPLHMLLYKLQLVLHLFFLYLQVIRFREFRDRL